MSRWFRLYDEVLDDPKVQRLSSDDFKSWINLLCLASRNNGTLPPLEHIAFCLRMDQAKAAKMLNRLVDCGLIDRSDGPFKPHGWNERQYKSDVSTDRVKRFRERRATVKETPPETDTETEADIPPKGGKRARRVDMPAGVDPAIWDDFIAIRKAKKAPMSDTALDTITKEAAKAGITLNAALTECCSRGWQSFKADWITKGQGNGRYPEKRNHFFDAIAEAGNRDAPDRAGVRDAPRLGFGGDR